MMKISNAIVAVSAVLAVTAAAAGCKKPAVGACVVAYDDLGGKGDACTVVSEPECKDDMSPGVTNLSSSKKKAFTAAKTCKDIGFVKAGCANVPIAWSFEKSCPK